MPATPRKRQRRFHADPAATGAAVEPVAGTSASPAAPTHASRAAALFAKAQQHQQRGPASASLPSRNGASSPPSIVTPPAGRRRPDPAPPDAHSSAATSVVVPLNDLLKRITCTGSVSVREALAVAAKLVQARLNNESELRAVNAGVLEAVCGVASEELRKRVVAALKLSSGGNGGGGGGGGGGGRGGGGGGATTMEQARAKRARTYEKIARDYGAVGHDAPASLLSPSSSSTKPGAGATTAVARDAVPSSHASRTSGRRGDHEVEYVFHEELREDQLRHRFAWINRAPVMTAWATVVLERLGFQRREALSLAHCYVNTTSTARGISLGILPESRRDVARERTGSSQPHFELMGVRIPVMRLQGGEWRGISAGEVVGPEKAFNYMRGSMQQMMPLVLGALTLLAESWKEATDDGAEGAAPEPEREGEPPDDAARARDVGGDEQGGTGEGVRQASDDEGPLANDGPTSVMGGQLGVSFEEEEQGEGQDARQTRDTDGLGPRVERAEVARTDEKAAEAGEGDGEGVGGGGGVGAWDELHRRAYQLYTDLRPATSGEWGKKGKLYLGRILALRRGHEEEWERVWQHGADDGGPRRARDEVGEALDADAEALLVDGWEMGDEDE